MSSKSTCQGRTQSGRPCENPVAEGSRYCHLHQEQATGTDSEDRTKRLYWIVFLIGLILLFAMLIYLASG